MLTFYEKHVDYVLSLYLIVRLLTDTSLILPATKVQLRGRRPPLLASRIFYYLYFPFSPICRSLEEDDDVWTRTRQEAANLSATINEILGSYDPKLRPNAGGKSFQLPLHMQ